MHTYLLPGMLSLAGPLGSNPAYLTPQGGLDVQKRFAELDSEPSNSASLAPKASFSLADSFFSEQRWLVVGTILIAVSLFWLGLSQLSHLRSRLLVFGGWESASRGAGATMQMVGERLGITDQFLGVDELVGPRGNQTPARCIRQDRGEGRVREVRRDGAARRARIRRLSVARRSAVRHH